MIDTLAIANFQSHKDTVLKFASGVNVIVGATDSGKTAIIRALLWLSKNRPGGDSFRSTWGGQTEVWLTDKNAYQVTRYKNDKGGNVYKLNDDRFEAFGTEVPDPIREFLNMDEINIQEQLDAHFLISATPGETAAYFNRIAHLDQIDSGMKTIQGWLRKLGSQRDGYEANIQIQEEELKQYEFIPKFEARLEVLEGMQEEKEVKGGSIGKLSRAIKEIEQINVDLEEGEKILSIEPQLSKILDMYRMKAEDEAEYEEILKELQEIHSINKKLRGCRELQILLPQVTKILDLIQEREELKNEIEDLEDTQSILEDCSSKHTRIEIQLDESKQILENNTPDECPFCGTNLTKK